jgi:hypothetical protein
LEPLKTVKLGIMTACEVVLWKQNLVLRLLEGRRVVLS